MGHRHNKLRFASIIVTYRCNARCHMCNTWQHPTKREEELPPENFEKLPFISEINITGGEPFLRDDLGEIISILKKRSNRIVVSTNGYLTERIVHVCREYPDIGVRVSIEGLPKANDELRGLKDGFDRGLRTLIELHYLGLKDIGFGITVSDRNAKDLIELYRLARMMDLEFATAAIHNSFYFHKFDNRFEAPDIAIGEFKKLISEMLRSSKPKEWFRAYFNYGLIKYIKGEPRLLPCEMGHDSFFLDPFGNVRPCNVMDVVMGNIREKSFEEIWNSDEAERIRSMVRKCDKPCWMMGSVSQQMKKYISKPVIWITKHKLMKKDICA